MLTGVSFVSLGWKTLCLILEELGERASKRPSPFDNTNDDLAKRVRGIGL